MLTKKIHALSEARALVARLEKEIAAKLREELAKLPSEYGFDDASAFLDAVKAASEAEAPAPARGARKKPAARKDDAPEAKTEPAATEPSPPAPPA